MLIMEVRQEAELWIATSYPICSGYPYCSMVRREVIPLIAEQSAILSIQNVSTLMCISGNGFVQSSEDNEV